MTGDKTYDFIIVGAGPAGASIASQLARSPRRPSILLVEAGGPNTDMEIRVVATHHKLPHKACGYRSTPNRGLNDRVIGMERGNGLGGGSAINGTAWIEGLAADFERMARLTGDPAWQWDRVKKRYNGLTRHHAGAADVEPERRKYIDPAPGNVGTDGPLHIGYSQERQDEVLNVVDIWDAHGVKLRNDANDGSVLGIAVYPMTQYRGVRTMAGDLLFDAPPNLDIVTDTQVHKVLFDDTGRATGITANDGRSFSASKEVILCGGSMDSPKMLMHSGIGPADQLAEFGIPPLHANPNVGRNFQDHLLGSLRYERKEHTTTVHTFFRDQQAQKAARREWDLFRTGPLATINTTPALGFIRSAAVLSSPEFAALPAAEREHMSSPSVPSYEIVIGAADFGYYTAPNTTPPSFCVYVILQNLQSRGRFSLQSADPGVPLLFDTDYFSHPYDECVAVESVRETMRVARLEAFSKDTVAPLDEPASDSDDDILAWWREKATTTWHMSSTCAMGRDEVEDKAVVDERFRVFGVRGLKVVDASVYPFCPTGHTQALAYQSGLVAAEKLMEEYGLDA